METSTAVILTQLPIAIAILIGAYELYKLRKELIPLLEKALNKSKKKQ